MIKNVLIIEDEADIRALYIEVLQDNGYSVIEAADGFAGLTKAKEDPWDLMLLDIVLPGNDGVAILKNVKSDPNIKDRPVILLTNLGVENVIHDCFELGASGYLIKSEITPDKIIDEINAVIDESA